MSRDQQRTPHQDLQSARSADANQLSSARQPDIEMNVESVVLQGFQPAEQHGIPAALQLELTNLLAHDQTTPFSSNVEISALTDVLFQTMPGDDPERIGEEIARAIYRKLRNE